MNSFRVFFKDVDPDTGLLSQVVQMCACDFELDAKCIQEALSHHDCENPNRYYYVVTGEPKAEVILAIADSGQLEMVRTFQEWCAVRGVRCIIGFGQGDTEHFIKLLKDAGQAYMLTVLSQSEELAWIYALNWELRMSTFEDEQDFDTIVSLLQ